ALAPKGPPRREGPGEPVEPVGRGGQTPLVNAAARERGVGDGFTARSLTARSFSASSMVPNSISRSPKRSRAGKPLRARVASWARRASRSTCVQAIGAQTPYGGHQRPERGMPDRGQRPRELLERV